MKSKVILNEELGYMKYLFDYKKGVVVSEQKLIKEGGCPCDDGTTSEMCCSKPTQIQPDPSKVIELEQTITKAQRELEIINKQKDEETKKQQIADLQSRFDATYNKLLSSEFNKMSKIQREELLNTKKTLELQLNKLKGLDIPQQGSENKKTTDQKVSAWVSIASSVLALFTSALATFKKQ
jgi:hypothetical protein